MSKARKEDRMKNGHAQTTQTARHVLLIVCVAAVAVAFTASRPQAVYAHDTEPPPVPPELEVPEGNKVFREGHAVGTQNYICLPSGSDFVWTFFGPQATLFNDDDEQIVTHFLSPNPDEGGMARATWQHSRDTSTVWAMTVASSSTPTSSSRVRFPGSCSRSLELNPGPPAATG
jgi:hypothetical protein